MYSNTRDDIGYDIQRFQSSSNGSITTNRYDLSGAFYRPFTVSNGNVQGNKHSPNPISYSYYCLSDRHWYQYQKRSSYSGGYFTDRTSNAIGGPWASDFKTGVIDSDNMLLETRDRSLEKIFEAMRYGKGNLVVDLAESRETLKMLKNATSVRKLAREFMKNVVKPHKGSSSKRLKYATDKWLEYRYGWMPFVSSTYELLKTLSAKVDKSTNVPINARSGRHREIDTYRSTPDAIFGTRRERTKGTCQVKTQLKVSMRARNTLSIYDFTSLNPAGIAWELTPLSFIGDWFANIGQTMQLWEDYILFANLFNGGFQTQVVYEDIVYTSTQSRFSPPPLEPNGQQKDGFLYEYISNEKCRRRFCSKSRTVLLTLPTPGGIRVDVNLNAKRLLDAASLIRGAFVK